MRSWARWRELLGVLGGLVDLGHLGVLDQVVDSLGATDGLTDGRHAAIGDELGLGSLDVLDAGLLELGVDVVLGQTALAAQAGKDALKAFGEILKHEGFLIYSNRRFQKLFFSGSGKPLLAESLGAMERASEEGALLDVGSHVPITNQLSLAVASEFGAARVWLSPELTLRQIEEVAKDAPVELGVLLIGAQELMVTEHCMLMSQGPCDENCAECPRRKSPHVLKDRKGYEFPVVTDAMGRSHLYNAVELDIASSMPELLAAGISSYMVDATLMNAEETAHAVGRAIRALHVAQNDGNAIAKMPNTTSGHLYRGVS